VARRGRVTRTVFFDIGDTLVHRPTVGPGKRLAEALGLPRERGRAITQLVFREAFGSPAELAARLRSLLEIERDIEPIVTEVWEAQQREPVEVPGATACVEAVAAAGARVGVISNIWAPYAAGFRRACPAIVPRIESWHLSYEVGISKPDPGLYRAALAATGSAPELAVMVGDSFEKDIVPAIALGMGAIWVPGGTGDAEHASGGRSAEAAAAPGATMLPTGAVYARDLVEVRTLLMAAIDGADTPRVRLSTAPSRGIGTP